MENSIHITRKIDGKHVEARADYNENFDSWDITIYQNGKTVYTCGDPDPFSRIADEMAEQLKL